MLINACMTSANNNKNCSRVIQVVIVEDRNSETVWNVFNFFNYQYFIFSWQ